MKTAFTTLAMVAVVAIILPGCTSTTTTSDSRSTNPVRTTEKNAYSKEELDKRGRQTPAEALAAEDPSITVTHR